MADTALAYQQLTSVRALVTAIQRQLCSTDDLIRELADGPRQGGALLRRAVADLLDDVHSVAEAEAVEVLHRAGVDGFLVNAPIADQSGRVLYRVDLLWPELRATIEIDSREFHFTESEWKQTMARHNELTDLGFAVKHYPPSAVRSGGLAWAREVREWLDVRAAQPAPVLDQQMNDAAIRRRSSVDLGAGAFGK